MSMDFLDEETIEVGQLEDGQSSQMLFLEGLAVLKNKDQNAAEISHFSDYNNPLLNAGAALLSYCITLSRMPFPSDMYRFRKTLVSEITELKQKVSRLEYPPSVADKTCFLFCIALDEFILHAQWGEQSGWENHTLVSDLFGVRDGGEQFFTVTEKALAQPKLLADLLELIYFFLKIGFKGQYRLVGREQLDDVIYRIEEAIFDRNTAVTLECDIETPVFKKPKPRKRIRFVGQLILFVCGLVLLLGGVSYWYQSSYSDRSISFRSLPAFNKKYLQTQEDAETVYISEDHEMLKAIPANKLEISRVKQSQETVSQSQQQKSVLTLEITAFDSRLKATRFLRTDSLKKYQTLVINIRNKYRVVIQPQNESDAERLTLELRDLGFNDVFYYYYDQLEAR